MNDDIFTKLLDAAPDPMIVVDQSGEILFANTQAEVIFGYEKSELIFQPVELLVSDNIKKVHVSHRQHFFENPHTRPMGSNLELIACRKDQSQFPVEISLSPLETENGLLIISTIRDITERKLLEEERRKNELQVQQSQKLESLGVLAGGIAHDFNNLLTSIMGNAGIAIKNLRPESPAYPLVEEIEKISERAADLIRQLLAYSGKGHFQIQPLKLSIIVEEMANLLKTIISKKAVLRFDFFPDLPDINGDATQIRQIIMNLITNASDAIGDRSGIISLRTGMIHVDREYLTSTHLNNNLAEGDYVFLEVADTGKGMDRETVSKIFDPFFTTKFTGRGLGLAAVLGIIRGHGGAIKVYSEVSRGTTFKVLFPCAETNSIHTAEQTWTQKPKWNGAGAILVADDEESVRALLHRALTDQGFDVILTQDGREAVQMFASQSQNIMLLLLDLTMPHLGGEEAFTEIRRIRQDIPIIMMSGYTEEEVTSHLAGKGVTGFLQKPFKIDPLLELIYASIDQSPEDD